MAHFLAWPGLTGGLLAQEARQHIATVRTEARGLGEAAWQRLHEGRGGSGHQGADWLPAEGEEVQLPGMGGANGQVDICK